MSGQLSAKQQLEAATNARAFIFRERINELAEIYGSIRAVGRALNIDHVYLHRLSKGEKTNPSKATLRKLGLE